jgi:hypothetical protein
VSNRRPITSRTPRRASAAAKLLTIACATAWVWGQTRVDNRVGVQVNTRVNNQLYGDGGRTGASIRYAQATQSSVPMRSEVRHAYWQSGATPSDLRMGYAALGPMAPGGVMSYIPAKPDYTQRRPSTPAPTQRPRYAGTGQSTYTGQSVRYSSPSAPGPSAVRSQAPSRAVTPSKVSSALVAPTINNASPASAGSVWYAGR